MSQGLPPPPPSENPYGAPPRMPDDNPPPYGGGSTPPGPPPGPPPGQPGGYGPPAPPPPPGSGAGGYDAVEAIKYGWAKFTQNAGQFVAAAALVIVISGLFSFLGNLISASLFDTELRVTDSGEIEGGSGFFAGLAANALVSFIGQIVTTLLSAGVIKMAFDVIDGKKAELGTMFQGWDKIQLLVAALICAVLVSVGLILCILPGIAVAIFTAFTTAFIVDRRLGAVDAIKASIDLVRHNFGAVLLWILCAIACVIVGAIACLVGLLVAIPVVVISQAYTVRVLSGQQVAPAS